MASLKRYFESKGGRPCNASELVEFKRACTPEEYDAYVKAADAELAK